MEKKLSRIEAVTLVAGSGIGTGILALPAAVSRIGLFGAIAAYAAAFLLAAALSLMIVFLKKRSFHRGDLTGVLEEHLFFGKAAPVLRAVFFILLSVILLENLAAYILAAADVFTELFFLPAPVSKLIFFALSLPVTFFGMKGVGVGEKISVAVIAAVVLLLSVCSFFHVKSGFHYVFGSFTGASALYGLFLFAFSAIFAVTEVCDHIEKPEDAGKAVIGGLVLNALLTALFCVAAILSSDPVTPVAVLGMVRDLPLPGVGIMASLFVLFSMLSSFWCCAAAAADMLSARFRMGRKTAWCAVSVPALLAALFLPLSLIGFLQVGSGALFIILLLTVLPAFLHAVFRSSPALGKKRRVLAAAAACPVFLGVIYGAVSSFFPLS